MRFFNIICMLVLFQFCSHSDTNTKHYVDKNAKGHNNGSSWSNAWESFSDIDWSQIQPGDVLYISGGTDSTVYNEQLNIQASGTADNHITIRNSYDAKHNGRVILRGTSGTDGLWISFGDQYITVKGLELRNWRRGIYINGNVNVITIDSVIIDEFYTRGVDCIGWTEQYDTGPDSITFQNINITTFDDKPFQTDAFYVKYSSNIVLKDSYLRVNNLSSVNSHSDVIQTNPVEGFKLINNILICDSNALGIVYIAGAVNDPGDGQVDSVIIYNNYMYGGGIYLGDANYASVLNPEHKNVYTRGPAPHFIAHNTIVAKGPCYSATHMADGYPDGALILNNIIVQFEGAGVTGDPAGGTNYYDGHLWQMNFRNGNALVDSIRNNLMWTEWSTGKFKGQFFTGNDNTGIAYSWSEWVNTYGGTGVNGDPLFVQRHGYVADQGTLNGELQAGSPAINQGEDLQAIIEGMGLPWTDINGNPRDSSPDIGAYQYVP